MKNITLITLMLMFTIGQLHAQNAGAGSSAFFNDLFAQLILATTIVVLLIAVFILYRLLMAVIKVEQQRIFREKGIEHKLEAEKQPTKSIFTRLYDQWTQAVPVEQEADVLLDHGFDGIRELDNKLPPWWVALFYVTIIWGFGYMVYYHFTDYGPSSYDEYLSEVKDGEEMAAAFLAKQANLVDENNVTMVEDENALANGQTIFKNNCAVCHGQAGEGGVGPNMTDEYFIHGGSIKDIFKVIKYGVPEKGMISWKSQIRPVDMQHIASYIMTLQGTNPPNAKAPEGEKYTPPNDAETTPTDTTTVN